MRKLNSSSSLSIVGFLWLAIGLSGCSDFRQAIGTEKCAPDEFEVVVRPPLSLPLILQCARKQMTQMR